MSPLPPAPPLLAFAHPGLLWAGLGLVAVPILIHLFFRRRHRVIRWAAMDFLLAALKKQRRRMELENLILLLLRCAAILLLAVAVARPAVDAPSLPFGGGARGVVLVIDTSTSMGAMHTGRSAFDRAKERAAKFLSELPEGSQVTLVASRDDKDGAPRTILEKADRGEARVALAGMRLAHGPNRLGGREFVFDHVATKLKELHGRRLVVFVTDLQRRDWYGETAPDTAAGGRAGEEETNIAVRSAEVYKALENLDPVGTPAPTPVVLVDAGQDEIANVTITDLSVDSGRPAFTGKLLSVTATLLNYGPAAARGTITLMTAPTGDGPWERVFAEEVKLKPPLGLGAPEPLAREFLPRVPAKSEGSLRFRALFTPHAEAADLDRLAADSERLLAMRVRPPVRVLPVRTFSASTELLEDVELVDVIDFLPAIAPAALLDTDLSGVDVVLWADAEAPSFSAEDVAKLEAFVDRGGGLLAYFGLSVSGSLNLLFEGKKDPNDTKGPLLPARIGDIRSDREQPVKIEREDERTQSHPLFKETSEPLFFSPDITDYRQVSDFAPEAVVARYTITGEPAVLEKRYGRGRVVMVTTTPDARGFDLNGSLLPAIFFFNAAQYMVWEPARLRNVTVGDSVDIVLPPGTREVEVLPPPAVGGPTREPVVEGTESFPLTDTTTPGIYRVVARGVLAGATALPTESAFDVAVNLDAREGDLRRVSRVQLKRDYQGVPLHFADEGEAVLPRSVQGDKGDASRAFLGGVVALLFVELLCAWRFGSRRRPGA